MKGLSGVSSAFQPDGKEQRGGAPVGGFYRPGLKVVQTFLHNPLAELSHRVVCNGSGAWEMQLSSVYKKKKTGT